MADDTMTDAELDTIVAGLEQAGLVEVYKNADGKEPYRLTSQGVQVARSMAMGGDKDAQSVLDALLDASKP